MHSGGDMAVVVEGHAVDFVVEEIVQSVYLSP